MDNRINLSVAHWRAPVIAGLIALPLFTAGASAQFYATPQAEGAVVVTDAAGAEVPMVEGDPVGTRPEICPVHAFYFNELDTDKAQMVLTDCATGEGSFGVEFQE